MATTQEAFGVPVQVDLQLQQLVDISGSVDDTEFNTQRLAWASAFDSLDVKTALEDPNFDGMCFQFIYWSGENEQQVVVDWLVVTDTASANTVRDAILALLVDDRPFGSNTFPSEAINFGVLEFENETCEGKIKIIDVSGDGTGDEPGLPPPASIASDNAIDAGVDLINGLPIGGSGVKDWYVDNIQNGGPNSFTLQATGFGDLAAKAKEKILHEIQLAKTSANLIGGQITPLDKTSVLIAGIANSTYLIVPAIAIIGGAAVIYLNTQKNKFFFKKN